MEINQYYSVARAYLCLLLIVRVIDVRPFYLEIIQLGVTIQLRVPTIRIFLLDLVEPLIESEEFTEFIEREIRRVES